MSDEHPGGGGGGIGHSLSAGGNLFSQNNSSVSGAFSQASGLVQTGAFKGLISSANIAGMVQPVGMASLGNAAPGAGSIPGLFNAKGAGQGK